MPYSTFWVARGTPMHTTKVSKKQFVNRRTHHANAKPMI